MKKLFALLYIVLAFSAKGDYWTQKADFGGIKRAGALHFQLMRKVTLAAKKTLLQR